MRYCALVPARNEARRIASTLAAIKSRPEIDSIVVIDDASTDATYDIAAKLGLANVIRLPSRRGKGDALNAGIEAVGNDADVFVFLDADLGDSATECVKLIGPIERDEADMTIGMLPPDPSLQASGAVGGGMASRAMAGETVFDSSAMQTDAESGLVGGAIGESFGVGWKLINARVMPKIPSPFGSFAKNLARMEKIEIWQSDQKLIGDQATAATAVAGALAGQFYSQVSGASDSDSISGSDAAGGSGYSEFGGGYAWGDYSWGDTGSGAQGGITITVYPDGSQTCNGCAGPN